MRCTQTLSGMVFRGQPRGTACFNDLPCRDHARDVLTVRGYRESAYDRARFDVADVAGAAEGLDWPWAYRFLAERGHGREAEGILRQALAAGVVEVVA